MILPAGGKVFVPTPNIQTLTAAHPAFRSKKMAAIFLGVKSPGREADHSPSFSAEVKMNESITPVSLMTLFSILMCAEDESPTIPAEGGVSPEV